MRRKKNCDSLKICDFPGGCLTGCNFSDANVCVRKNKFAVHAAKLD